MNLWICLSNGHKIGHYYGLYEDAMQIFSNKFSNIEFVVKSYSVCIGKAS